MRRQNNKIPPPFISKGFVMQFLAGINRQYRDAEADIDWLRSSLSARLTKSKADLINAKNRLKHRNPHLTERYRELEPLLTDLTKQGVGGCGWEIPQVTQHAHDIPKPKPGRNRRHRNLRCPMINALG
jgi:hypothetical protein